MGLSATAVSPVVAPAVQVAEPAVPEVVLAPAQVALVLAVVAPVVRAQGAPEPAAALRAVPEQVVVQVAPVAALHISR